MVVYFIMLITLKNPCNDVQTFLQFENKNMNKYKKL